MRPDETDADSAGAEDDEQEDDQEVDHEEGAAAGAGLAQQMEGLTTGDQR